LTLRPEQGNPMFVEKNSLAHYGFSEEKRRNQKYVEANLNSYELHVIKNHVVSLPYHYWFDRNNKVIFTDKEKKNPLKIDSRERNGLYKEGIISAVEIASQNPSRLVFLYSPPGPASFEANPPEEYAKPYNIGQLYLMWHDKEKINNIAVSINNLGEDWLKEIFSQEYLDFVNDIQDVREKTAFYITAPYLSTWTIDDFLKNNWEYHGTIFKSDNLDGKKEFKVADVINEVTKSLKGQLKTEFNHEALAKMFIDGLSTEKIYKTMIGQLMQTRGLAKMALGGGCGGEVVKINDLLPFTQTLFKTPNLSSKYRLENQKDEDNNNDTYPCPHCTKPISYEKNPQDKASWRMICPHCGGSLKNICVN